MSGVLESQFRLIPLVAALRLGDFALKGLLSVPSAKSVVQSVFSVAACRVAPSAPFRRKHFTFYPAASSKLNKEQACKRCPVLYPFNMALSVEMVAQEAMNLPTSGRALLVEKLLASLAGEADPKVERAHLDDVRERRAAVRSGKSRLVEGTEAIRTARSAVRR